MYLNILKSSCKYFFNPFPANLHLPSEQNQNVVTGSKSGLEKSVYKIKHAMLLCCHYMSHVSTGFAPPNLLQKLVWIIAPSGGLRDKEKKTKAQTNAASLHENQHWDRWEKY